MGGVRRGRRALVALGAGIAVVLGAGVAAVATGAGDDASVRSVPAAGGAAAAATGRTPTTAGPSTTTSAAPSTTATTDAPTTVPPLALVTTTTAPPAPAVSAALVEVVAGARPVAAGDPVALADQIVQSEAAIRDPATAPEVVEAAGRLSQVAYRALGEHPEWDQQVFDLTPPEWRDAVWRQASARREFRAMHTRLGQNLPAWRIVDPLPADELLAIYTDAEAEFGVPWYVLAAVNLVETGMGRIVGLSSAGAQGPMQFMPGTWERYGMGGDVWNTRDAVRGAANYLRANGGADGSDAGLDNALFRYNNDNRYVRGVRHYAEVMRTDPRSYYGFHAWPIVYLTAYGDITLPTGYEQPEPIPVVDWLAAHPQ